MCRGVDLFTFPARCKTFAVERGIDLPGAQASLRVEGTAEKVFHGPDRGALPFTLSEGDCTVDLPPFRGFDAPGFRLS